VWSFSTVDPETPDGADGPCRSAALIGDAAGEVIRPPLETSMFHSGWPGWL
jgi:hypothetical protein